MRCVNSEKLGNGRPWVIWILAVLLLASSGLTYRLLASYLELLFTTPISLPLPLNSFPVKVGGWEGTELAIPNTTREYMKKNFADEFLSRRYVNSETGAWADVYVVYCSSRPGGIIGHKPSVCYPANGWVCDSIETSQFTSLIGRQIPCLIHRFQKPALTYQHTVVLNFYILNGIITIDESDFSGFWSRRPNISGNPSRYVAQIQISSVLENSIQTMGKDITDLILDFLPDQNNKVGIVEYKNVMEDIVK